MAYRFIQTWKRSDFIFKTFYGDEKRKADELIKTLHDFTDNVIRERRELLEKKVIPTLN